MSNFYVYCRWADGGYLCSHAPGGEFDRSLTERMTRDGPPVVMEIRQDGQTRAEYGQIRREDLLLPANLQEAMAAPALARIQPGEEADPEAARAACHVAYLLGRRHILHGGDLGVLPPEVALAATRGALVLAAQLEAAVPRVIAAIDEAWDTARWAADLGRDALCDLLDRQLALWAVYLAIDDADMASIDENPHRATLVAAIDALIDASNRIDALIAADLSTFTLVLGSPWLQTRRQQIQAGPCRDRLPWCISQALEDQQARDQAAVEELMPGPKAWAELRRRLLGDAPSG